MTIETRTRRNYTDRSNPDDPRWLLVDVEFERKLAQPITLTELKQQRELSDFLLNKRGNRLSVFSVRKSHWDFILGLERKTADHNYDVRT